MNISALTQLRSFSNSAGIAWTSASRRDQRYRANVAPRRGSPDIDKVLGTWVHSCARCAGEGKVGEGPPGPGAASWCSYSCCTVRTSRAACTRTTASLSPRHYPPTTSTYTRTRTRLIISYLFTRSPLAAEPMSWVVGSLLHTPDNRQ